MNIQTKNGKYIFNVWNIARSDISLNGHYQIIYNRNNDALYYRKCADYGGLTYVVNIEKGNFIPAEGEIKKLFIRQFNKRLEMVTVVDFNDTFDCLRKIYNEEEMLLDNFELE